MKQLSELARFFGKVLSEERKRVGFSQEKLAEAIDATNVFICLLERGQRQPSLNTTILLAQALGLSPEELVARVCRLLDKGKEQRA